jgi:hypothetical protein
MICPLILLLDLETRFVLVEALCERAPMAGFNGDP